MTLRDSLTNAPVIQRGEYNYIVHPLLDGVPRVPPALLREWVTWAKAQPGLDAATVILAPEAMALPLAALLGQELNLPYVVARKRSYGLEGETIVEATTGYAAPTLYINDIQATDRVLIVDDVISTGGTLRAVAAALETIGASIVATLCVVDKSAEPIALPNVLQARAMHRLKVTATEVAVLPQPLDEGK